MLRTLDQHVDLLAERAFLLEHLHAGAEDAESAGSMHQLDNLISTLERNLAVQPILLRVALEMEGGRESLEFWPHAGELQLAFTQGQSMEVMEPILARAFATLDAEFKLEILLDDLSRIRDQHARMLQIVQREAGKTGDLERVLDRMQTVLAELAEGHKRFVVGDKMRGSALNEFYRGLAEEEPAQAEAIFRKRTISFHALINNLVPQYVPGGICRVGARMPDLTINRQVEEDLHAIITEKVLATLPAAERGQPRAVIAVIQNLVGSWLGLSELQDLQSPAHQAFDTRSDGLILLAGIDPAMRIGSRSTTDLTAALLLRTGDCRETLYLNGALYACYQHQQVLEKLREAMECLNRDEMETLYRITDVDIPAILCYQLRGAHVAVYVEGISVRQKYRVERFPEDDPTAIERPYGVE